MIGLSQRAAAAASADAEVYHFDVAAAAMRGSRQEQEDCLITHFPLGQKHGFAVLADGMGGHAAGKVASALAVAEMFTHLKVNEAALERGSPNLTGILRAAAEAANARIAAHSRKQADTKGMGTTLLAPVFCGNRLSWISIGDSPLLLLRDGALYLVNRLHSMAAQIDLLAQAGQISADEARDHPERNVLTSALTGSAISQIDCPAEPETLRAGDIVIAASDGILTLPSAMIAATLAANEAKGASQIASIVLAALQDFADPEQDNATIAIVKVIAQPRAEVVRRDMAVLAVTREAPKPDDAVPPAIAPIEAAPILTEAVPVAKEEAAKRKSYFYRGQQYFRDD